MKVPHSKTGPALAGVVALAAVVFPTPAARAQTSELSVQVTPEVTVVGADGARAVPLTSRISSPAPQDGVVVNFE
ncbi:MAG: hypothetical protein ACRDY7_03260, partial [Acidimicrobiia bacterium]